MRLLGERCREVAPCGEGFFDRRRCRLEPSSPGPPEKDGPAGRSRRRRAGRRHPDRTRTYQYRQGPLGSGLRPNQLGSRNDASRGPARDPANPDPDKTHPRNRYLWRTAGPPRRSLVLHPPAPVERTDQPVPPRIDPFRLKQVFHEMADPTATFVGKQGKPRSGSAFTRSRRRRSNKAVPAVKTRYSRVRGHLDATRPTPIHRSPHRVKGCIKSRTRWVAPGRSGKERINNHNPHPRTVNTNRALLSLLYSRLIFGHSNPTISRPVTVTASIFPSNMAIPITSGPVCPSVG